jgi:hypothetical protein
MQQGKSQKSISTALGQKVDAKHIHLSFHVTMPTLARLKQIKLPSGLHTSHFSPKRRRIGVVTAILILGVGSILTASHFLSDNSKEGKGVLSDSVQVTAPTFKPLLPDGDTSKSESLKYDTNRKVMTYTDTIDQVSVTISQQQLPEAFKTDTDSQVEKMAKNFNATEIINESNPKSYLGTSIKGPQTAIFVKNGVLVFIQSARTIDKHSWAAYITKLQ